MVSEYEEKCFIISNIRGDFRLLVNLITKVIPIAIYEGNVEKTEGEKNLSFSSDGEKFVRTSHKNAVPLPLFLSNKELNTQIHEKRKYEMTEREKWKWNISNITLVCLGDFVNRFNRSKSYNHLRLTSRDAIEDEIKIIQCFESLKEQCNNKNKNDIFILMGDHEISNLVMKSENNDNKMKMKEYKKDQMQNPSQDHELRKIFVDNYLYPFCKNQGIVFGWGSRSNLFYMSHGCLNSDWLKKHKFYSVNSINSAWKDWLTSKNTYMLNKVFYQPDSPLFCNDLSSNPSTWYEKHKDTISQILDSRNDIDLFARFIIADTPIQEILNKVSDPDIKLLRTTYKNENGYTHYQNENIIVIENSLKNFENDVFFVHNASADTFCLYSDEQRIPQILELSISYNKYGTQLFNAFHVKTMDINDYKQYRKGRMQC
jgi:hypothetical protein